tara:strand:+ start:676 stop:1056 length:381 start_codon:yes stop_codon:yes gene_type:complete
MKKKYYYDCPIQALYMKEEFGVEFSEAHDINGTNKFFQIDKIQLCDFINGGIEDFEEIGKIYVAPESEHIFEPKEGDLGIYESKLWRLLDGRWFSWNDCGDRTEDFDFTNIIERHGKFFFNPKEEN